jgi:hypothetical protein
MRRTLLLLLATAGILSGCASDRFAYARQDPVIWFLSGMPAPYDLNWPPNVIPDLPVLNPVDYPTAPPLQPLDYPRGWSPDNPPLMPSFNDATDVAPQPGPYAPPDARCVVIECDPAQQPADPADAVPGDVRRDTGVDATSDTGAGRRDSTH